MYENVTVSQCGLMKHAIGCQGDRIKRHRYIAFRNYFTVSETDPQWDNLVSNGYATSRPFNNQTVYHVTGKGMDVIARIMDIVIIEGD